MRATTDTDDHVNASPKNPDVLGIISPKAAGLSINDTKKDQRTRVMPRRRSPPSLTVSFILWCSVETQMVRLTHSERARRDVFGGSCSPHRQALLCRSSSSCHLLCGCTNPSFYCFEEERDFFWQLFSCFSQTESFFFSALKHIPFRWNYFSNPLLQSRSL